MTPNPHKGGGVYLQRGDRAEGCTELGREQGVDGSGNGRCEGAADGDREAVHACGGLGVRLEGWVEGQEVREDGLFAVEEGESLLRRVHRLYHGQRRSHEDRKG